MASGFSTGFAVERIESGEKGLSVRSAAGDAIATDMVLVAVGSRPETGLARSAGIETGIKGAIRVNRRMETSIPDIYAAGDCAETYHRLLGKNAYLPLGTTAHKQGRIAGENAVGGNREYEGTLGTQSVKIFDLVAARTGLKDDEALKEGFSPLSADIETWDHKVYYPHAEKMRVRITGDRKSGRLLGVQIIGAYGTEVSKRIDIGGGVHSQRHDRGVPERPGSQLHAAALQPLGSSANGGPGVEQGEPPRRSSRALIADLAAETGSGLRHGLSSRAAPAMVSAISYMLEMRPAAIRSPRLK